ncbi:MAG: flippase [Bacilli bacterium]
MIKKQSVKNNFIFQFIYQALILIVPLVVSPYLTRILGDSALGTYSYVNSIAYYFVMIANLGILKHGQRIIAQKSKDEIELRKTFWSLFFLHAITSIVCLVIYLIIFGIILDSDRIVYLIQSLYVASALFDITWLFYGLENFKSVVIRNAIVKIVECVLIFVLVKNSKDLYLYTFIACGSLLLGQLIMIPQAMKTVKPIKFNWENCKEHIKPLLVFSISVIAVSAYTVFDKTLLGLMTTKENVAYYEYANKIISLPRTFVTIIGTVMFPRACKMASEEKTEEQKRYLKISLLVVAFIGMASLFGLASISKQFSILYYGETFATSGDVMVAMCAVPLIIGLGDIVRTQYLIPNHMDKEYTICIVLNAVVNLILSSSLIPVIGIYGAVVGTCAAELFGCVFQIIICRKFISPLEIAKTLIPFTISGAVMFVAIKLVAACLDQGIVSLLIQVGVGAFIFVFLSALYIFFFEKDIWNMAVDRMLKRKK